jgi:nitrate reductase delta subunit
MTATFKALSALLSYPDDDLRAAVGEIEEAITQEGLLDAGLRASLRPLFENFRHADLLDLQEAYVDLFDTTRRLSLHLFEHVHGDSRDRGQAMVDLASVYEKNGLILAAHELPDHLPLFLEYLSTRPFDEARGLLAETGDILAVLGGRLAERKSPYAAVFGALLALAGRGEETVVPAAEEPDDIDAAWAEAPVTFGAGSAAGGCSSDLTIGRLRAARRAAAPRREAGC